MAGFKGVFMDKREIDKLIDDMAEDYSINFIHSSTRAQTDGISHRELTRMLVEFADALLDKIKPVEGII